jgi:hypothetical protein
VKDEAEAKSQKYQNEVSIKSRMDQFCNFLASTDVDDSQRQEVYTILRELLGNGLDATNPLKNRELFKAAVLKKYKESPDESDELLLDVKEKLAASGSRDLAYDIGSYITEAGGLRANYKFASRKIANMESLAYLVNIHTSEPDGETALEKAVSTHQSAVIEYFFSRGATPPVEHEGRFSSLFIAPVSNGHADTVKALLNGGVKATGINTFEWQGCSRKSKTTLSTLTGSIRRI